MNDTGSIVRVSINMERILRLALQLTSNENEINSLPLPPIAQLEEGMVFPTFPQMKKDAEKLGGVFTYALLGKRRLTIFADPATFPIIFHPGEYGETEGVGDAVRMEMDKIAVRRIFFLSCKKTPARRS